MQGEALFSTLLYFLYKHDFSTLPQTNTTLDADDVAIYAAASFHVQTAMAKVQHHLQHFIESYLLHHQIKINPDNTDCINLTRMLTNIRITRHIRVQDKISRRRYDI